MPSVWRLLPIHQRIPGTRSFAGAPPAQRWVENGKRAIAEDKIRKLGLAPEGSYPTKRLAAIANEEKRRQAPEAASPQSETLELQQEPDASSESTNQPSSLPPSPHQNVKDRPILTIPPSILYEHWDLAPPSKADLKESRAFFTKHPAKLLFSAHKLLDIPFTSTPEVAIVGRSNVGKSTLLNALLQTSLAKTSSKPGKTKTMNAYDLGGGKMTLLDMPGYGRASRAEWGVEITKYLQRRKELRRVFVLIDAIHEPGEGRVKREDLEMLAQLRDMHIPHQIVLGKVDRALFTRGMKPPFTEADLVRGERNVKAVFADVKRIIWGAADHEAKAGVVGKNEPAVQTDGLLPFGQLLATTGDTGRWARMSDERSGALGVDALRWALLVATGYAKVLPSRMMLEKKAGKKAM